MRSAVVAFDKTNMDAVKALANQKFEKEMLRICIMKNKYPQGNAPLLLSALSGKKPLTEQSVSEAGYLIFDAEVCAAIYDAFVTGTPFIRRIVTVDGVRAALSPKEYELLVYLVKNAGIALTREQILRTVWGYDFFGDDRTLDTHIKLLRKSLGRCAAYIVTLRGVGYRFDTGKIL